MKKNENRSAFDMRLTGLDPKLFPSEKLFDWLLQPRHPVLVTDEPLTKMFIEGMITGEPCKFIYFGGSSPGKARTVHVSMVFQHHPHGRIYVAGYCPERSACRVLALDLIVTIYVWN